MQRGIFHSLEHFLAFKCVASGIIEIKRAFKEVTYLPIINKYTV